MTKSDNAILERPPLQVQEGWFPYWLNWKPTSMFRLALTEAKLINNLRCEIKAQFVRVLEHEYLNTIVVRSLSPSSNYDQKVPILMVHGMGAGIGMWCKNLSYLSKQRPVYAFDLLGFGRSSRPKFSEDPEEAEKTMINSIEDLRQKYNLNEFILVGHSFGGYLSFSYALKYPKYVKHLVLLDPWGFPTKDGDSDDYPAWLKAITKIAGYFYPLSVLRAAGPFGPGLIKHFRRDLKHVFSLGDEEENENILDYIYHCNAQNPSGEGAFKCLNKGLGWAKMPMLDRATEFDKDIPVTFIHGRRSWIDQNIGYRMKYLAPKVKIDVHIVEGAGHHVYAERSSVTNGLINKLAEAHDEHIIGANS